jgi:hypothetical protein
MVYAEWGQTHIEATCTRNSMSTMKPTARITFAERTGRTWRGFLRRERNACAWLMAQGMNAGLAKGMLWLVRLALLAALLYGAFWVALLLAFAFAGAWVARNADWDEETSQDEWEYGPAGYGLYTPDGHRIDPHDPQDEEE